MSTKELLAQYNERAEAAGVKTIKTWKGSKAQLQAKLDALPKAKKAKKNAPEGVTVADLAREAGKNPKVVRAKLRRIFSGEMKDGTPVPIDPTRWIFDEKDRDAVVDLIGA